VQQASAAKKAAEEQARAIRESAEQTRKQSEAMANAASAQQAAERANAAERAKQEAAAREAANAPKEEVVVDVGPKDAGEPVSRKRAKFQLPGDPSSSLRI
jgi:hypothetical protein